MLPKEILKQAAKELALALSESLSEPEECQHQFFKEFENKMQRLLSSVPSNPQIEVIALELSYN